MLRMAGVLGRMTGMHIILAAQFDARNRSAQDWILNIRSRFVAQRLNQRILNRGNFQSLSVHSF